MKEQLLSTLIFHCLQLVCLDAHISRHFSADSVTGPEASRAHEIAQRMRQAIAHVRCIKQVIFQEDREGNKLKK